MLIGGDTLIYDSEGLPMAERGKRRPNMPKTVTCHKCGEEAEKIRYGTYACKRCYLSYQFKYGKLVRGDYSYHKKVVKLKNGLTVDKGEWSCGFFSENGTYIDYPFNKC